jgi:hypothetical protein
LAILGVILLQTTNNTYVGIKTDVEADLGQETGIKDQSIVNIIDKLVICESGGNVSAIGDGGLANGILQFHEDTFVYFSLKYNVYPYSEREEIKNFYLDNEEQKNLAYLILTKEKDGWRNWYNCGKKIGLDDYNSI